MSKFEVLKIKSRIRTKFWVHFYEFHLIFQCNLNINNNRKRSNIPIASVLERIRQEYRALSGLEHLLLEQRIRAPAPAPK